MLVKSNILKIKFCQLGPKISALSTIIEVFLFEFEKFKSVKG